MGSGCDDRFEFEFGVDLMLAKVEHLHRDGWRSPDHDREAASAI